MNKKRTRKKVCFISSAGGHLEQIKQLKKITEQYDYYYVLPRNESTEKFTEKKYFVSEFIRNIKILYCVGLLVTFVQQFFIFIKERPDVVITTGAGLAIPTCIYAKVFRKKVIYIESFARINSVNKTGKLIYKFADLFIVQWENLLEFYPNAVYGGWIY